MNKTKQIVLAALFIAIGVALPQAFHAIPNAGSIFLPMHIPVLIAGFALGPLFGALCGVLTPILSHLLFGMPPAMMLAQMVCELACYGLLTGLLNRAFKAGSNIGKIYVVLILSMIGGRIIYGLLNYFIFKAGAYSLQMWLSSAFITALSGIAIQLLLIPVLVSRLKKAKLF